MKAGIIHRKKRKHQNKVFEMMCQSNPKEIEGIEKFLQKINSEYTIDDGTMYRLLVSCTEAVNNAIIHGNKSDPGKKVVIRCSIGKKYMTMRIKDEGEGFDPDTLQDPREEKNLMKENGRGFFLMRSLMDSVSVKKIKSGSVVTMKVKLHGYS